MKFWILFVAAVALGQDQTKPLSVDVTPAENRPSDAEQQDLMHAMTEAQTSAVDLIRVFEAHLKKYPNTVQRGDIERALAAAAADNKDNVRVVLYGERVLAKTPEDAVILDRVANSLLALGGKENAQKALKLARTFEDLIDGLPQPSGKNAVQVQEDRDRAMGRVLLYQSHARSVLEQKEDAERAASRSFSAYPNAESARAWADCLLALGRTPDAISHLADAFAVPDPRATDMDRLTDRLRLGDLYAKLTGSEKGLGDEILAAYDRTSTLVESHRKKLLALDPNSSVTSPLDFTITSLDGKKLQMSKFKGKVIVLDFWATWCGPCRIQHPMYEEVKKHFGERDDLVFLNLNTDEDRTLVQPFLEEQKWDPRVYYEDGMARLLQVSNIPTTILFNRNGQVSSRMNGFIGETFVASLIERIDAALAE